MNYELTSHWFCWFWFWFWFWQLMKLLEKMLQRRRETAGRLISILLTAISILIFPWFAQHFMWEFIPCFIANNIEQCPRKCGLNIWWVKTILSYQLEIKEQVTQWYIQYINFEYFWMQPRYFLFSHYFCYIL